VALLCLSLEGGGAERVMITVANALATQGHAVDLVLLRGKGPYVRDVDPAVRVIDLAARHAALGALPFYRYLRRERPQVVLSTLVGPNAIAVAGSRLVPRARRARVVVREANTLSVALQYRPWASRVLAGAIARVSYPLADAVVAVSEDARDDLARFLGLGVERVIAIHNPSITPATLARSLDEVDHAWFAEDRAEPVLVAAGRLVRKKGFDVLLDALALVRRERAVRLQIMGEGEERPALEKRIAQLGLRDCVELAGFVDNPFARFARADLFVLPSLAEGMPNVLVEAMACGCPVVATNCPSGPREILRGGRDGALVTPGDPAALAAAILETLAHPPDRASLRARAADFEVGAVVAAYAHVLGLSAGLS
jgi:glycosyltransferase involved in cell wall biosynthesis